MAEQSPENILVPVEEMEALAVQGAKSASFSATGFQISEGDIEKRFQIVRSVGEECIQEDELRNLLTKKVAPICYDGFEPSGRMHIAQLHVL